MNLEEKRRMEEFNLDREIEVPQEMNTDSIAESVRLFVGPSDAMEEMENYEEAETTVQSPAEHHVKANTGVIKDLQLLPEDDSVPVSMETSVTGKVPVSVSKEDRIIPGDETENMVLYPNRPLEEVQAQTRVIPTIISRNEPTVTDVAEELSDGLNFAALSDESEYEHTEGDVTEVALTGEAAELLENLEYHDEDVVTEKKRPKKVHHNAENDFEAEEDMPSKKQGIKVNGAKSKEEVKKHAHSEAAKQGERKKAAAAAAAGNGHSSHLAQKGPGSSAKGSHSPSKSAYEPVKGKGKRKFQLMDGIMIGVAAVILITVAVLGIVAVTKVNKNKSVGTIASVGVKLSSIEGIGQPGIANIIANKEISVVESVPTSEEPGRVANRIDVTVNFASIEKDLKIKFTDKATDKLITGVAFKVEARTPDKKNVTWEDTDKDGVIYMENMTPGTYYVKVLNVDDFEFPDKETEVTVKDKISYVAINVMDEVKKASEVDLAKEDLQTKEVDKGEALVDTVAWVNSGSKTVYKEVKKEDLTAPTAALRTWKRSYTAAALNSLTLSEESLTVVIGKTATITATIDGDATETTWETDKPEIATVNGGTVTGVAAGDAVIKCTVKGKDADEQDITIEKTCKVTVKEEETPTPTPTEYTITLTLSPTTASLDLKDNKTVKLSSAVEISEGGPTEKGVTYKSSDETVATVAEDGTVTAVKAGTATITCTTKATDKDGKAKEATCAVTVTEAKAGVLKSLTLNKTEETLAVNGTLELKAEVKSDDANADKTVTWASDNKDVADVDANGKVTAKKAGSAKITCTTKETGSDGKVLTATCTIKVSDSVNNTKDPLKDKNGTQVYVKEGDNYREAKIADYYKFTVFYLKETQYTGWQTVNGATKYYKSDGTYVTGEQVIGGVKYNFANDGTLSMGGGSLGIDVSQYNGTINWNAVKAAGVSFVIIRCGFRGYTQGGLIEDTNFHSYASGAQAAGLKVGVYFFSQATNEREAVEEASMAVAMAKQHKISYPIFIDSEYANGSHTGRADKLTKAQRTAVCKAFCETVKSAGYTPGVYASKFWYYDNLDASALNAYKIWLAHYTKATDYKGKYEMWQSSSTGRINGINGNVDIDTSYLGY
ncbi:MAG: Ig-like domain-containing protein [Lachnospiraceae bacterium]|nr:Ig-like domain-containing protein [Lachnospiraceae bacterium]